VCIFRSRLSSALETALDASRVNQLLHARPHSNQTDRKADTKNNRKSEKRKRNKKEKKENKAKGTVTHVRHKFVSNHHPEIRNDPPRKKRIGTETKRVRCMQCEAIVKDAQESLKELNGST